MKTSKLLVGVIVVQSLVLVGQWTGFGPLTATPAQAQIPDAGGQRVQIIEQLKDLNTKMDKLMDGLENGKLQIKTTPADDKK
jgi:hypothetical protein